MVEILESILGAGLNKEAKIVIPEKTSHRFKWYKILFLNSPYEALYSSTSESSGFYLDS